MCACPVNYIAILNTSSQHCNVLAQRPTQYSPSSLRTPHHNSIPNLHLPSTPQRRLRQTRPIVQQKLARPNPNRTIQLTRLRNPQRTNILERRRVRRRRTDIVFAARGGRVVRPELEIAAVLGVETGDAAVGFGVAGRLLQFDRLRDDAAAVFLEVGGFAEGRKGAGCGVVRGDYDGGGGCYGDCDGWRTLRDDHGLKCLSAGSDFLWAWLLTCGGGQVVCVDVVVVGVMVKHEQALETRAAGYCETKVGRGPSRLCWGVPA